MFKISLISILEHNQRYKVTTKYELLTDSIRVHYENWFRLIIITKSFDGNGQLHVEETGINRLIGVHHFDCSKTFIFARSRSSFLCPTELSHRP